MCSRNDLQEHLVLLAELYLKLNRKASCLCYMSNTGHQQETVG